MAAESSCSANAESTTSPAPGRRREAAAQPTPQRKSPTQPPAHLTGSTPHAFTLSAAQQSVAARRGNVTGMGVRCRGVGPLRGAACHPLLGGPQPVHCQSGPALEIRNEGLRAHLVETPAGSRRDGRSLAQQQQQQQPHSAAQQRERVRRAQQRQHNSGCTTRTCRAQRVAPASCRGRPPSEKERTRDSSWGKDRQRPQRADSRARIDHDVHPPHPTQHPRRQHTRQQAQNRKFRGGVPAPTNSASALE